MGGGGGNITQNGNLDLGIHAGAARLSNHHDMCQICRYSQIRTYKSSG